MENEIQKIGKIAALENCPTTITHFTFWTNPDMMLSPFDIVKVRHVAGSTTFGQVEEISHITDSASFMSAYISNDFGQVDADPPTERVGLNYVKARVLGNSDNIYLPVHNDAPVYLATRPEIEKALGFDNVQNKVICGTAQMYSKIPGQKLEIPVPLNRDFLIGPEGAHLNISGISGLASKTSYAMFLVKSLTEALASTKDDDVGTAAFVILNVKGKDLLAIDELTRVSNPEKIFEEYTALGLEPKPLSGVKYFYPSAGKPNEASTFLGRDALERQRESGKAKFFKFTSEHDIENLDLLFSGVDDPQQTIASIIDWLMIAKENETISASSWNQLMDFVAKQADKDGERAEKGIAVQSWRKFFRHLRLQLNSSRAFSSDVNTSYNECLLSDELMELRPNDVFVVDVAHESESMQAFVFGYVMRHVLKLRNGEYDEERVGDSPKPDRIVIVVDELNKYCSKDSPKDSPILKQVLDITERGRSLGVVLFGAEQFRSAIHERVTGNCATKAYGRTNSVEVSKKDYGALNGVQKDILMRLTQGEYIVENPVLRAPVRIRFPHPIFHQYK